MIYSTRRDMNAFESYFQKARLTNERRYMQLANKERKSVANAMELLKTEIDGLPLEKHAEAAVLISNIRDMLSTHPEFSQDMIDRSIRPKDRTASPAVSEKSVHDEDDEQFFPPSPTHSAGSVPDVPDDWEASIPTSMKTSSPTKTKKQNSTRRSSRQIRTPGQSAQRAERLDKISPTRR